MKKVICTILAMVTLSTSVSAATNVTTFGTVAREALNGAAYQRRAVLTETMKYTEYDSSIYIFGVKTFHSSYRTR